MDGGLCSLIQSTSLCLLVRELGPLIFRVNGKMHIKFCHFVDFIMFTFSPSLAQYYSTMDYSFPLDEFVCLSSVWGSRKEFSVEAA